MPEPIELTLAHSPDADDMVMFWPLTGMRGPDGQPVPTELGTPAIDCGRFIFRPIPDDVQRLNRRAIEHGDLDITAISAHAYARVQDQYAITGAGGSFGEGYGPRVVVSKNTPAVSLSEIVQRPGAEVLVPGLDTTAYLSLCVILGTKVSAREMLFSEIPGAVARGEAHAGVLIHEAQLSFDRLGLRPIADLGVQWHERFASALPLGLNVVRRDLDARYGPGTLGEVSSLLSSSIAHAIEHREQSKALLRLHASNRPEWLDDALVDRYLDMYVSDLTRDMGQIGTTALATLFDAGHRLGLCPRVDSLDPI